MRVVKVENGSAVLEPLRLDGCVACPFKESCNVDPDRYTLKVDLEGKKVTPGDVVEVKTPKAVATRLSFVVYTIPLLIFISLLVLFKSQGLSDEMSFVLSIVPVAAYYVFLRKLDERIARRYKPKIVSVRRSVL